MFGSSFVSFRKQERGDSFVATVEEEMSRNRGDQDLNSAQTVSDRHSLYEILERKVESVVQRKMQLREDYLKLRLIRSANNWE